MDVTYKNATAEDVEAIYKLSSQLIYDYEDLKSIDCEKVLKWVRRKIETVIGEYTVMDVDGQKAGYYHFYRNEEGILEIDDLYVLPPFQNQGIGTEVVRKCCADAQETVMLYVFIKNERAVSLYKRLGFEITETVHGSRYIMKKQK